MAVTASQVAVGKSTAASLLVRIPPGPSTVILSNTSGVTVWVGGVGTKSTTGFGIPTASPPVVIPGYVGSAETDLYAIGTSSAASLGVLVSTSH